MTDIQLIRTYSLGVFILAFIEEYPAIERTHSIATIFNTIVKKHDHFINQVKKLNTNKIKKVSKKCALFTTATIISEKVWRETILSSDKKVILITAALKTLFFKNKETLNRIYAISEKNFTTLTVNLNEEPGTFMESVKVVNLLINNLEKEISHRVEQGDITDTTKATSISKEIPCVQE